MKNMNDKTKKRLIIASGILISVVLIFMISTRLQNELISDPAVSETNAGTSRVVVDDSKTAESAEKEEVTVPPIKGAEAPSVGNGADDTGTEQTIQEDIPAKPTYTEEQLTDRMISRLKNLYWMRTSRKPFLFQAGRIRWID